MQPVPVLASQAQTEPVGQLPDERSIVIATERTPAPATEHLVRPALQHLDRPAAVSYTHLRAHET